MRPVKQTMSSVNTTIKPVQAGSAGFCQTLMVLGWASSSGTHPSRDYSLSSDKPTAPLDPMLVRRWLVTVINRETALPDAWPDRRGHAHCTSWASQWCQQGRRTASIIIHSMKILSCIPTQCLHLPGLHFFSYQAGRWESLQL